MMLALLLAASEGRPQQSGVVIVANASLAVDSISKKDLASLFLKRRTTWPNGMRAVPVDQKYSADVRAEFSETILGKGLSAVESYWNGQVFSGKDSPPTAVGSDAEVLDFVRNTSGAVGYVSATATTSGVKVLRIVG